MNHILNGVDSKGSVSAAVPSANGDNGSADAAHGGLTPPARRQPSGRDAGGRFVKGNKGGPGNPFTRQVAALREALLATVGAEDIQAIVGKLVEKAKAGDVAAAKLVLAYVVGKPVPAVDPDAVEVQEWQLLQRSSIDPQEMQRVLQKMNLELVCPLLRTIVPCVMETMEKKIGGEILGQEMMAASRERGGRRGEAGQRTANGRNGGCQAKPTANGPNGERQPRPTANGHNGERQPGPTANGDNGKGETAKGRAGRSVEDPMANGENGPPALDHSLLKELGFGSEEVQRLVAAQEAEWRRLQERIGWKTKTDDEFAPEI